MAKHYQPIERCKTTCQGHCCQALPGMTTPKDIQRMFPAESLEQSVIKALESGKFAIDWYVTECDHLFFIRPATKKAFVVRLHQKSWLIYDGSWGGTCIFLTGEGCNLPYQQRPETCKVLKPSPKPVECELPYKHNAKKVYGRLWRLHINLGGFVIHKNNKVEREEENESEKRFALFGL